MGTWDLDRDPLAALREGKRELFEEFVRTEFSSFRGFFERLGAGSQEAEDLAQEVLLKLHRHLRTLRSSDALVAWVWRTTTNHCVNCIRKRRRERLEFVEDVDWGPASRASGGAR